MWTPRRILMLVAGILFCGTAYLVYAFFLGWIDGLPALPENFVRAVGPNSDPPLPPNRDDNPTMRRIQEAFGPNTPERDYYIKVDSRAKGITLLANDFQPTPDGRVELSPCSVIIYGKTRGPKGMVDISTMHCDRALIEFDKPVRKYTDMEGRKFVAAELRSDPELKDHDPRKGHIHITNNRRSANPEDYVIMRTPGPIYYKAEPKSEEPHIWSESVVELTDRQNSALGNSPDSEIRLPTVTAQGMKLFLLKEEPEPTTDTPTAKTTTPKPEKKIGANISGVEQIVLNSNVTMNLMVGSSFLGSPKDKPILEKEKEKEKSLVQIHTDGPFYYNMQKDHARFERPAVQDPAIPAYVQVTRQQRNQPGREMLTCDMLDIQFIRKKNLPKAPTNPMTPVKATPPTNTGGSNPEAEMEIEKVHAWGKEIVLSSDAEDLHAWGNDLTYDAQLEETILKGSKVTAVKEGNQIEAIEMIFQGMKDRSKQQIRVKGPGQIDLVQVDPQTKESKFTRQARWNGWLTLIKTKEQNQEMDILTLTDKAKFLDKANKQFLEAEQLKVWLVSADKPDPKALVTDKKSSDKKNPRPYRLEAIHQVKASSPELDVRYAEYLNVWFKEIVPPPSKSQIPAQLTAKPAEETNKNLIMPIPATPNRKIDVRANKPPKQIVPIQVSARKIESWVHVTNGKNELDRARCEDQVAVHQDPTEEREGGVDITGQTVELEHHDDGNILTVLGTTKKKGEVFFDKLTIRGEDITIDQRNNLAQVKGIGSMRMLSATNLQGEALKEAKYVNILWKDSMEFHGSDKWARFEGAVQADQDDSRVLCESMHVTIDRPVWLNQATRTKNNKPDPKDKDPKDNNLKDPKDNNPKIDNVVCDQQPRQNEDGSFVREIQPVIVREQLKKDHSDEIQRLQQIEAKQIIFDNQKTKIEAPGPGTVRIFQMGAKDTMSGTPNPNANGKKDLTEQEMKLTVVDYKGRMVANNQNRTASFFDQIDVIHLPSKNPDLEINRTKLPIGAIRLKCDERLDVYTSKKRVDNKEVTYQNLKAEGHVQVWSEDLTAIARKVTYEEEKDMIIFEGSPQQPVRISQQVAPGAPKKESKGQRITYNRRTKTFSGDIQSFSER